MRLLSSAAETRLGVMDFQFLFCRGRLDLDSAFSTGGVSLTTVAEFINAGASALGVGTDLVDVKAIRAGNAHIVTGRAKQFVDIVRHARAS